MALQSDSRSHTPRQKIRRAPAVKINNQKLGAANSHPIYLEMISGILPVWILSSRESRAIFCRSVATNQTACREEWWHKLSKCPWMISAICGSSLLYQLCYFRIAFQELDSNRASANREFIPRFILCFQVVNRDFDLFAVFLRLREYSFLWLHAMLG